MVGIQRKGNVRYIVLTPNKRGFDEALAAGVDEVAVFGAATEGFSQHNINCSVAESLTGSGLWWQRRWRQVFASEVISRWWCIARAKGQLPQTLC